MTTERPEQEPIRLQKYLAQAGVASRRRAETFIRDGRVAVNGQVVTQRGTRVAPGRDSVLLDGRPVPPCTPRLTTILLHKPRGYLCTRAEHEGKTVYDLLHGVQAPVVPVGRLDKNSEGLLLLSDDGALVNELTHPRFGHEKTYQVTVSGDLSAKTIETMSKGMVLDGYRTRHAEVRLARKNAGTNRYVLEITLREGRNRQIRKMCDRVGLTVHRLVRRSIGNLTLRGVTPGRWRILTQQELRALRAGRSDA